MLNYIWIGLIALGVLVAVSTDLHDLSANTYHNGEESSIAIQLTDATPSSLQSGKSYPALVIVNFADASTRERLQLSSPCTQKATLTPSSSTSGTLHIFVDDNTPALWKQIFKAKHASDVLTGRVAWPPSRDSLLHADLVLDPVTFAKLNAVTNDGVVKSAKTAVELSIGLIGIMALWLGIMKIAEAAGLVAALGKLLRPLMTRIFPEVPHDHPAMGAMIMNISANMLGLSNAATPLGLKAMEELNSLNPDPGTATNAMCTFLAINTGNVQLIPATVIALRAAAGSSNPTEILGPVIVASIITMTVGITSARWMSTWKMFNVKA